MVNQLQSHGVQENLSTKLNALVLSIYEKKVSVSMNVKMLPNKTISLVFNVGKIISRAQGKQFDSISFTPSEPFYFIKGLHTALSQMHTHRILNDRLGLILGKLLRYKQFLKALQCLHQPDVRFAPGTTKKAKIQFLTSFPCDMTSVEFSQVSRN